MLYYSCDQKKESTFEGNVLVWPSVSYGNVGQLALDLLINTLLENDSSDLCKIGYLYSKAVLPIAGNSAFTSQDASGLCINLEVYQSLSEKLVLVQQRAPIVKHKSKEFGEELTKWIQECKFSKILIVSSIDDTFRNDPQITRRNLIHYTATDPSLIEESEYIKRTMVQLSPNASSLQEAWKFVRGAGIAPILNENFFSAKIKSITFSLFCAEGNNVPDAYVMAKSLNDYLKMGLFKHESISMEDFKYPSSWNQLFGRPTEISLFQ